MLFWISIKNEKAIPTLCKKDVNKNHIKNMYTLLFKRAFCSHSLQGSMTIEAAIVVPFVFFVWVACIALSSVVRVHETIQNELTNSAIQLSMAAGIDADLVWSGSMISAWYGVQNLETLEAGGVEHVYGFDFSGSQTEEGDWLELKVKYRIDLLEGLIPIPGINMQNRVYTRKWTGGSPGDSHGEMALDSNSVYVTEYGHVYHVDRMCTHIRLKIYMVNADEAKQYTPCGKCADESMQMKNTYYVTETGDRYHSHLGCSGLKRTVEQMNKSSAIAGGYTPCSRCGGGGG